MAAIVLFFALATRASNDSSSIVPGSNRWSIGDDFGRISRIRATTPMSGSRERRIATGNRNLPVVPAVFPDAMAPVVRNSPDSEHELSWMRWGFAAAKARPGTGHQCAQSDIALLARLAQGRMTMSRAGNVLLRVDR
jgi:hypothetical protein